MNPFSNTSKKTGMKSQEPFGKATFDGVWNQEDESGWLTEIQIPVRNRAESPGNGMLGGKKNISPID